MRVCYFGAFDPSYARNNFLRRSLERSGCQVVACNVPPPWPTYRKYPPLIHQYRRVWRECDLIVVAEFGQTIVPLAWTLGRLTRRPVVFDFVIGLHEASVVERRRYDPKQFSARKLYWLDKSAGNLSDRVLTGTRAYKQYLSSEFGFPGEKILLAPLGVNDEIFRPHPPPAARASGLVVLYWGSYIPNHGVDVILQAAARLKADDRLNFRFVGDGEGKAQALQVADSLELSNVEFLPRVPFEALPAHIAQADIVLGVFGDTPQAKKAMANKVLEGLAMQKSVITGDTLAVRENFDDREHLWLCPLGDPAALAAGLRALAADRDLRSRLATRGYQRVVERLTPAAVGTKLKADLSSLVAKRQ